MSPYPLVMMLKKNWRKSENGLQQSNGNSDFIKNEG
jgi:hypothetical protein